MKNIGVTPVLTGTLAAAILGLAGPAAAATDIDIPASSHNYSRVYSPFPRVHVPQVDTSVHTRPLEITTSRSPQRLGSVDARIGGRLSDAE